jgi:hypothetical protein
MTMAGELRELRDRDEGRWRVGCVGVLDGLVHWLVEEEGLVDGCVEVGVLEQASEISMALGQQTMAESREIWVDEIVEA